MTDEEILRRILHEEALTVNPEGSFDDVERLIRRTPRWLAPVAAAAALAVVVGAVALVATQDGDTDVTTTPATDVTTPTTTALEPAPDDQITGEGVWPFTTGAEADAWAEANPNGAFFDPSETAVAFLQEYVGMTDPMSDDFAQGDNRSGEVVARTRPGGPETVVLLRLLGESDVWTVTGAFTDTIRLEAPGPLEAVDRPVQIRGESCCTFEGNVVVQVREDGQVGPEEFLGQEPLIGGSMADYAPLEGQVAFARPSRPGGAVVAFTTSAEDGNVERATVVKVWFGTTSDPDAQAGALPAGPPLDADQMIAVSSEAGSEGIGFAVVVMDADDGSVTRELTSGENAEGGILDVALTPDRRTVLYALSTTACGSELHAVATDGAVDRVIAQELSTPREIAVHPRDGRLAISTDDDCDGQSELWTWDPYYDAGTTAVFPGTHWPDAASDETGADALVAVVHSIAWVDDETLALGMGYEDGTTIRLHDLTNPGLPVGSGPDVSPDESDGETYDTPTTTGADGTFAVIERCCGDQPTSSSRLQHVDRTGAAVSGPALDLDGYVSAAQWALGVPYWITGDSRVLERLSGEAESILAQEVVDFAL